MTTTTKLTTNEAKVLTRLIDSADGNGHDFGFIEDARGALKSADMLGGVVASLVKKGLIVVYAKEDGMRYTQFTWPTDEDGREAHIGALQDMIKGAK